MGCTDRVVLTLADDVAANPEKLASRLAAASSEETATIAKEAKMTLPGCEHPNVCQLLIGWYVLGGGALTAVAVLLGATLIETWRHKR